MLPIHRSKAEGSKTWALYVIAMVPIYFLHEKLEYNVRLALAGRSMRWHNSRVATEDSHFGF